jgi:hypothetical protein
MMSRARLRTYSGSGAVRQCVPSSRATSSANASNCSWVVNSCGVAASSLLQEGGGLPCSGRRGHALVAGLGVSTEVLSGVAGVARRLKSGARGARAPRSALTCNHGPPAPGTHDPSRPSVAICGVLRPAGLEPPIKGLRGAHSGVQRNARRGAGWCIAGLLAWCVVGSLREAGCTVPAGSSGCELGLCHVR